MTLKQIATQLRQLAKDAEAAPPQETLANRRQQAGQLVGNLSPSEQYYLVEDGLGDLAAIMGKPIGAGVGSGKHWQKVLDAIAASKVRVPGLIAISKYPPVPWDDEQGAIVFAVECRMVATVLEYVKVPQPPEVRELFRRASIYLSPGRTPRHLQPVEGAATPIDRINVCWELCVEVYAAWAGALAGDAAYSFTPEASASFNAGFVLNNLPMRLRLARDTAIEGAPAESRAHVKSKLDPLVDAALDLVKALQVNGASRDVAEVVDTRNEVFRDGPWIEPFSRLFEASYEIISLLVAARQAWPPAASRTGAEASKPTPVQTPEFARAEDFSWVMWCGTRFQFSPGNQAATVGALWNEWERSGRQDDCGLSEETLGQKVGSSASDFRMDNVFRGHPAFGTMICKVSKGVYALRKIATSRKKSQKHS